MPAPPEAPARVGEPSVQASDTPARPVAYVEADRGVARDRPRLVADRPVADEEGARHRQAHDGEYGDADHHLDQREAPLPAPHGCSFIKISTSLDPFGPRTVRVIFCRPTSGLPGLKFGGFVREL